MQTAKPSCLPWLEVIYNSFSRDTTLMSELQTNVGVRGLCTSCWSCTSRHKELSKWECEPNAGKSLVEPLLLFLHIIQWPFYIELMKVLGALTSLFSLQASMLYSLCSPFLLIIHIRFSFSLADFCIKWWKGVLNSEFFFLCYFSSTKLPTGRECRILIILYDIRKRKNLARHLDPRC